ncbi:glycerate kinase type-2 family protein [Marinomonas epiphytica]
MKQEAFLRELFRVAVNQAHPDNGLLSALNELPPACEGKTLILGAGKAAAAMALIAEQYFQGQVEGLVVTPYNHGEPTKLIEVVEAAHPVPDKAGQEVAQRMLSMAASLGESDRLIFLVSGGGSALLALPVEGVTLTEKKSINKQLLRSGASIDEINCVRKKLSKIKGGKLAVACAPAPVFSFAISDVPGDEPSVIASGPTVIDNTSSEDALDVVKRYGIEVSGEVMNILENYQGVDPSSLPQESYYNIISTPQMSLDAAADYARAQGVTPIILGDLEGESRDVAKVHAGITRQIIHYQQPISPPCVILSGGETTVTVKGQGRGGRNAEFLLALTLDLKGQAGVSAIACDTDGIDGSEDNAGAVMLESSYENALALHLNPRDYLEDNNGYGFFEQLEGLVFTAPTRTNVNDFRAIYIQG